MIVIRIWGGLGNQMFQYAMGYAKARKYHEILKLDTSFFQEKHNSRQTERTLDLFQLPITCTEEINSDRDLGPAIRLLKNPYVNYAIRKFLPIVFPAGKYTYVKEHRLEYVPQVHSLRRSNVYYDGYWHSDKYFKEYREELCSQFVFSNASIEKAYQKISQGDGFETVAIHIRRGDYITQNNPNARGVEYYKEAISILKGHVADPIFCFFSDDLNWVKDNFGTLDNLVFVNEDRMLNDIEEFQLMARCHHQIISNSSYSWWAAWLNNNKNKIVVVPKVWKNKKDMMLDEWIKI